MLSSTFLCAPESLYYSTFSGSSYLFYLGSILSSLHLPIAVRLSRPAALDLVSSDPLTLVSLDLSGCNLLQYHQCTVCLYLAPNHVIWCKIMQPRESPWITANKWESGKTNRTHLQLSKYKMLFWALYEILTRLKMTYTGFHQVYSISWLGIERH